MYFFQGNASLICLVQQAALSAGVMLKEEDGVLIMEPVQQHFLFFHRLQRTHIISHYIG